VILIPERPIDLDDVCRHLKARQKRGRRFSIVVVAEGAHMARAKETTQTDELDEFGHVRLGGIGAFLAREIERATGIETRATVLGHIQRGGTPTARDRVLGTRYGVFAADLVRDGRWGLMAALQGDDIVAVTLETATKELHLVDPRLYEIAEIFFG
jgi:6-phosphofructokinase 1